MMDYSLFFFIYDLIVAIYPEGKLVETLRLILIFFGIEMGFKKRENANLSHKKKRLILGPSKNKQEHFARYGLLLEY